MMNLIYCYDAYCGWCYGFSEVIKRIAAEYKNDFKFEVLSGGMILPETPQSISVIAPFIEKSYKTIEERTGVKFGEDFLFHIIQHEKSDWFPSSEKPAIALCIFKEIYPDKEVAFASDLQYALNYEGRDLTDDEAYRHLLEKYEIPADEFFKKLHSEVYKDKAYYEFQLVKQLKVESFPQLLLQVSDSKFYLVAKGYTEYEMLKSTLDSILIQIRSAQN
ncbi:MAG TPA: DsbA family protein [Edaphocola sp.]|nr:DsbA family protein [Edaphocola sp.]